MQRCGASRVRLDDDVWNRKFVQTSDQPLADQIVSANHDVIGEFVIDFPRCPHPDLRFEPRRIEKADEGEGRDNQEHHDAVDQDDDAEESPEVASESDVPETEGTHHRKGPVEARQPRMLLALVHHDDVKDD